MADNCTHNCDTCSANCSSRDNGIKKLELSKGSKIKKIIGVSSGKGGVGKSFVTANLANMIQSMGYKCGILDADILGPSIPKAFGIISDNIMVNEDSLIIPKESNNGVKILSSNFLLKEDNEPIIYRGTMIAGLLQQFYTDTFWGELDYLFIDMPPGTGDVPLTTYQSIPIDKVIIVTSPQNLVSMIVEKSINMAKKMNIEIMGIIENMSYVECPNCNTHINIFGNGKVDEIAREYNIKVLSKIPIKESYIKSVDNSNIDNLIIDELKPAIDEIINLTK